MNAYTCDERKFALDLAVRAAGPAVGVDALQNMATKFLEFMRPPTRQDTTHLARVGTKYFVRMPGDPLAQRSHTIACALVTGEGETAGRAPECSCGANRLPD